MKKVIITCPDNMSEQTYTYICTNATKMLGADIEIEKVISKDIIGGFTIAYDSKLYDLSIKTQITNLKNHMRKN